MFGWVEGWVAEGSWVAEGWAAEGHPCCHRAEGWATEDSAAEGWAAEGASSSNMRNRSSSSAIVDVLDEKGLQLPR
jgi:hypothetical protein